MLTPRSRFPLGHAENGPCLGPAAVEGGVGHNLGNLVLGDAVLLCTHQMIAEALIGQALRHQRHHRDKGTVPQRELVLTAPHLTKQHIIVQFCELRRKGDVGGKQTALGVCQRIQEGIADKILSVGRVGRTLAEHISLFKCFLGFVLHGNYLRSESEQGRADARPCLIFYNLKRSLSQDLI